MEDLKPMFNNQAELDFLLDSIKPSDLVLEWGSGGSTLAIAERCKLLVSIEHDKDWVDKVVTSLKDRTTNVLHFYVPRNKEEAPGHDGTEDEYHDYIKFPVTLSEKFNIIFIDGRCRVGCAKEAVKLLKPNGSIFIHDYRNPNETYRRKEYEVVEDFLEIIGHEYALYQFKPK